MAKTVGLALARRNFYELIRAVEAGETVIVTRRGKEVAVISPPSAVTAERARKEQDVDAAKKVVAELTSGKPEFAAFSNIFNLITELGGDVKITRSGNMPDPGHPTKPAK